ncbi:DUF3093 family protein [Truepera radiovictrix]|uniref:Bacterial Pleckstrin homology domain-containing protein n=1 Tax=Truepera radiovictrix (strain DSM 17093 / CIP 108686 / LMG 22925 / RQ-24) TaxID=649638 RepID=D7CT97_TRURR|nr:DUF3093 family protein [Truepera radiovictrix]ADI15560.1 hypothetical protein Trad_2451 [Truepera radiovictrix DSM 17093]WMT58811.1 DUF3093 family protein [Truepera radiovictrix]
MARARYTEELPWPAPARWLLSLIFASFALPPLFSGSSGPLQLATALVSLGFAALVWDMSVLRIRVDDRGLRVGYRFFSETIPHGAILRCGAVRYDPRTWGGYGVRSRTFPPNPPARLYNVPGDGGVAVQLLLADRQLLFSSRNPAAVCAALRVGR